MQEYVHPRAQAYLVFFIGLNWEVDSSRVITSSPWYLLDGDLLIWKDIREQEKPYLDLSRPKEKGLKIHTHHLDDDEVEGKGVDDMEVDSVVVTSDNKPTNNQPINNQPTNQQVNPQ